MLHGSETFHCCCSVSAAKYRVTVKQWLMINGKHISPARDIWLLIDTNCPCVTVHKLPCIGGHAHTHCGPCKHVRAVQYLQRDWSRFGAAMIQENGPGVWQDVGGMCHFSPTPLVTSGDIKKPFYMRGEKKHRHTYMHSDIHSHI